MSVREMTEIQQQYAAWMRSVTETYGELPDKNPVKMHFPNGKTVVYPYMKPEFVDEIGRFLSLYSETLVHEVEKAASLEAQRDVFIDHMRIIVNCIAFTGLHPAQGICVLETMDKAFDKYREHDEPMSRELLNMRNDVRFYLRICYDSIECMEGLVKSLPEVKQSHWRSDAQTPYAAARLQYAKAHPVSALHDETNSTETQDELYDMARVLFCEAIAPYRSSLPEKLSADMLGIILRCAEYHGESLHIP
ncbi:MAG: hypothetical protein B7X02_03025, partial [Rhodospirillales bacterium 12-54-5]